MAARKSTSQTDNEATRVYQAKRRGSRATPVAALVAFALVLTALVAIVVRAWLMRR